METTTTVLISAVVATIVQGIKLGGVNRRWGVACAAGISLVVVLLWGFSHETHYEPIMVWNYFTGFVAVAGTAIGIHSAGKNTKQFVDDAADARRFTGTGEQ